MIEEIERYAKENNIPIMLPDGIEYLCNYIKEHNIKNILEIGSAIGYSAIRMASVSDDIKITTNGYGHGVGMSQYGANEMAKLGYTYDEILKYYYKNIEIEKINV